MMLTFLKVSASLLRRDEFGKFPPFPFFIFYNTHFVTGPGVYFWLHRDEFAKSLKSFSFIVYDARFIR